MSSSRTAARLNRLLAMMSWVVRQGGAPVDEVCLRFGYSPSELARDLDLIFVCGLPGYGPGDLMDASIDDDAVFIADADYFARPVRLSAAECLTMLAGGMAMMSAGEGTPLLESALQKLANAVLPEPDLVSVDLGPVSGLVAGLRQAADEHRVVEIEYSAIGSGRVSRRRVEPWLVFASLGNWYLSAHCRLAGAGRVFRVDRIRTLEPTEETFTPPEGAATPDVRYRPGAEDLVVRLRLEKAAEWVTRYYPVTILSEGGEGTVVEFSASDAAVVARLLLRLGGAAELLPGGDASAVAAATSALRERIVARYR